jgi:hypothetical protein
VSDESSNHANQAAGADRSDDGMAESTDAERSVAQRTLDALVFAPAGILLTAVEDLPEMAMKGRACLEVQLRNARTLGQLTVTFGRQNLSQRLARLTGGQEEALAPDQSAEPTKSPGPMISPSSTQPTADSIAANARDVDSTVPRSPLRTASPADGRTGIDVPAAELAIPEYDTLSASQVVRRLDGLASQDLEAVYRHETATRRRRTILHRAQQLLGVEGAPGSLGTTA